MFLLLVLLICYCIVFIMYLCSAVNRSCSQKWMDRQKNFRRTCTLLPIFTFKFVPAPLCLPFVGETDRSLSFCVHVYFVVSGNRTRRQRLSDLSDATGRDDGRQLRATTTRRLFSRRRTFFRSAAASTFAGPLRRCATVFQIGSDAGRRRRPKKATVGAALLLAPFPRHLSPGDGRLRR